MKNQMRLTWFPVDQRRADGARPEFDGPKP